MNKILYPLWIMMHLILSALKWLSYPHMRVVGFNHLQAKHHMFHRDSEVWELQSFGKGDDIHYFSNHSICCSKCSYEHEASRAWPRADKWPGNIGSTFEEGQDKARQVNQYS